MSEAYCQSLPTSPLPLPNIDLLSRFYFLPDLAILALCQGTKWHFWPFSCKNKCFIILQCTTHSGRISISFMIRNSWPGVRSHIVSYYNFQQKHRTNHNKKIDRTSELDTLRSACLLSTQGHTGPHSYPVLIKLNLGLSIHTYLHWRTIDMKTVQQLENIWHDHWKCSTKNISINLHLYLLIRGMWCGHNDQEVGWGHQQFPEIRS